MQSLSLACFLLAFLNLTLTYHPDNSWEGISLVQPMDGKSSVPRDSILAIMYGGPRYSIACMQWVLAQCSLDKLYFVWEIKMKSMLNVLDEV